MRFALLSLVLLTIPACGPDKLQADIACSRSEACESDGSCAYREGAPKWGKELMSGVYESQCEPDRASHCRASTMCRLLNKCYYTPGLGCTNFNGN